MNEVCFVTKIRSLAGPGWIEIDTDYSLRPHAWKVSLEKPKSMVERARLAKAALNGS